MPSEQSYKNNTNYILNVKLYLEILCTCRVKIAKTHLYNLDISTLHNYIHYYLACFVCINYYIWYVEQKVGFNEDIIKS